MNFKIGDTLDYESVIGLGICSGKVVGVSNVGDGEAQYATVRNQKGNDITVHWTRVVKVYPSNESRTLGFQTDGSDLKSEVERLYIGWSKEIALAAEAKIEYEKVLAEKDSEIEGLKARLEALRQIREEDKSLVTELCDEVECHNLDHLQDDLIKRSREATHGT